MAIRRSLRVLLPAALLLAAACGRPAASSNVAIRLVDATPGTSETSRIEVSGVDRATRHSVARLDPSSVEWTRMLDVRVIGADGTAAATPVAGRYTVDRDVIRFTPLFPLDPGRKYEVRWSAADSDGAPAPVRRTIAVAAAPPSPPVRVTHVFPTSDVLPENLLRLYIHFSAPMGREGGVAHVKLLDDRGREVPDPFLPLDADLWNADRTRFTVFFDPGRQKRGILPNRQMGPSLVAGRRYTLVVDRAWTDGHGNPLAETFTRAFRAGPADVKPLDYTRWRISTPRAGTRDALIVDFSEPLDHGLLLRALGVRHEGRPVTGDARVESHETRWTVTPTRPWQPGRHELVALSILEDLAGNRIGRAFEADAIGRAAPIDDETMTSIPFVVAAVSGAHPATD